MDESTTRGAMTDTIEGELGALGGPSGSEAMGPPRLQPRGRTRPFVVLGWLIAAMLGGLWLGRASFGGLTEGTAQQQPPIADEPIEPSAPDATSDDGGDDKPRHAEIILQAKAERLAFGEQPSIASALVNHGDETLTIVLPVDGSNEPLRTPAYVWEATYEGEPITDRASVYWCGNVNPIRDEDLARVEPGGRVSLDSSWMVGPEQYFDFYRPGRFTIRLRYEDESHDGEYGVTPGAWDDAAGLDGPLLSNEIEIVVDPPSDEVALRLAAFEAVRPGTSEAEVVERLGEPDDRTDLGADADWEGVAEMRGVVELRYVLAGEPRMLGGMSIMSPFMPGIQGGLVGVVRLRDGVIEKTWGWPRVMGW